MYNYVKTEKKLNQNIKCSKLNRTCCPGVATLPPVAVSGGTVLMQPVENKLINVGFWPELTIESIFLPGQPGWWRWLWSLASNTMPPRWPTPRPPPAPWPRSVWPWCPPLRRRLRHLREGGL